MATHRITHKMSGEYGPRWEVDPPQLSRAGRWIYGRHQLRARFIERCLDAIFKIRQLTGKNPTQAKVAGHCGWSKDYLSHNLKRKAVSFKKLVAVGKLYADTTREERLELSCREVPTTYRPGKRGPMKGTGGRKPKKKN